MEGPCSKCTFLLNKKDDEKMFSWRIDCTTTLMHAAKNGHEHCVNILIQSGVDVNYSNSYVDTTLMFASRHGGAKCVDVLIKGGAGVNHTRCTGDTALSLAAGVGHLASLQLLIKAGADVNQGESHSNFSKDITALLRAAEAGRNGCVEMLLRAWANVNQNEYTALMAAARGGHVASLKMLLEAAADVNKVGHGRTALMEAARGGHVASLKMLLEAAADVNKVGRGPHGEPNSTALAQAVQNDHNKCELGGARFPNGVGADECVNLLLKAGAVVSDIAFLHAAMFCNYKCLDMFLKAGAKVNVTWGNGFTILQAVLLYGYNKTECRNIVKSDGTYISINHSELKCLDMLIKAGASVNASAHDGSTALIRAARKGQTDCVDFLISHGADMNQHDNKGITALMHANNANKDECVDSLIQS